MPRSRFLPCAPAFELSPSILLIYGTAFASGCPAKCLRLVSNVSVFYGVQVFFDVIFTDHTDKGDELLHSFSELVKSFAGVWRRFDHHCYPAYPHVHDNYPLPESEMAYLEVMTNELHAPQLSELAVLYREEYFAHFHAEMDDVHFQRILHYYSTWNVLALRHMSTINLIPIRFSGCTSLQSLSIGMDYFGNEGQQRLFDAVALAAFLSSCPVLRKVSLRFFWATGLANGRSTDRVNVGSVEELDLYLSECSASPVEYFMDAVRFPRVMSMKFVVACGENFNESNRYPRNIVQAVFSNAVVFPHMKQLEFSTNFGSNIPDHIRTIRIPIRNLPSLESLRLDLSGAVIEGVY